MNKECPAPPTMRFCSLTGQIIQSPSPSCQLQEQRYRIAGREQSMGELTTKDTSENRYPQALHSHPTDPPAVPLAPCPCTYSASAWNGLSVPLLSLPVPLLSLPSPYSLTQSSATAPAECSPWAHATQLDKNPFIMLP